VQGFHPCMGAPPPPPSRPNQNDYGYRNEQIPSFLETGDLFVQDHIAFFM